MNAAGVPPETSLPFLELEAGQRMIDFGHDPAGRRRKLAVSLMHLDKSSDEIMAAVGAHRPDWSGSRALDAGELPRDLHG